jgi:hypothetical protein
MAGIWGQKGFMNSGFQWIRADCSCLAPVRQRPADNALLSESPRNSGLALLFIVIGALLVFGGCARTTEIQQTAAEGMDLIDRLSPVALDTNISRNASVVRNGLHKDALILVAPVSVRASLRGSSGRMMLVGLATPMFNVGDGIQMDLYLSGAGERRLIGNRYFDSGRRAEDRNWIPIAFPVDLGQEDQLEIKISAGPQGDLVADWLALSSLRLMQKKVAP